MRRPFVNLGIAAMAISFVITVFSNVTPPFAVTYITLKAH